VEVNNLIMNFFELYKVFVQDDAVRTVSEALTIIFAVPAFYYTLRLATFFIKSDKQLSKFLKHEYWSDFLLYIVTFSIGAALFFNNDISFYTLVILRPWVILLNVLALRKLYRHLKRS